MSQDQDLLSTTKRSTIHKFVQNKPSYQSFDWVKIISKFFFLNSVYLVCFVKLKVKYEKIKQKGQKIVTCLSSKLEVWLQTKVNNYNFNILNWSQTFTFSIGCKQFSAMKEAFSNAFSFFQFIIQCEIYLKLKKGIIGINVQDRLKKNVQDRLKKKQAKVTINVIIY